MKLKPCPFCGKDDAEIFETESGVDGLRGEYYVMCMNCFGQSGPNQEGNHV